MKVFHFSKKKTGEKMLKFYNLKEHLWDVKSQNDPSCEPFVLKFEANLTKMTDVEKYSRIMLW